MRHANVFLRRPGLVLRFMLMIAITAGLLCVGPSTVQAREVVQSFTLKDYLQFDWKNQLVFFPLDATATSQVNPDSLGQLRLLDPSGKPVAFQYALHDDKPSLAFFVDMGPLQEVSYQLVKAESGMAATPAPAVTIEQTGDEIRMFNSHTGMVIANTLAAAQIGPVHKLLMADGQWVGQSSMPDDLTASSYSAKITARGPVYAEVVCEYEFKQGGTWQMRFRLPRDGKVVLIEEHFKDIASKGDWKITLDAKVAPTNIMYRVGYDARSKEAVKDALIGDNLKKDMFRNGWSLKPWHSWWDHFNGVSFQLMRLPQGKALENLYNPKNRTNDWFIVDQGQKPTEAMKEAPQAKTVSTPYPAILMGAGNASKWASDGQWGQSHRIGVAYMKDGSVELRMPVSQWPGREWFIGSQMSTQAHFINTELTDAHALEINYYDRPLDRIKDMVLSWPIKPEHAGSNLFPNAAQMKVLRDRGAELYYDINANRKRIKAYLLNPKPDSKVPAELKKQVLENPSTDIGGIILETVPSIGIGRNAGINSAMHHIGQRAEAAAIYSDAAFGAGVLTDEEASVVRAKMALMAYGIASGNMVNPAKGFRNHPNMTALMYGGLGLLACALPDHPEAKKWANITETMYMSFLANWSGPNGSWTEAPHYQLVSINSILVFGLAAHRSGISDIIYDPRIKKTVLYLAKISTPPDPTFANYRHLPPIGNTYLREPSSIFGIMAGLYEKKDPKYAQQMQWMWYQQGQPGSMVIGGDVSMAWFSDFIYSDIKPVTPDWSSEFFPAFGAAFHHAFGTDHETYMVYHHGKFSGHYDADQGSFEMWGKGQPLMLDWGYNGAMPAWQHNTASFSSKGSITNYDGQPWGDLAEASQDQWDRRIVFVKDPKTDGPAYYVVQDIAGNLKGKRKPTALWYWFNTTQTPRKDGQNMRVVGPNGVDLDVWFDKAAADSMPMLSDKEWAAQLSKSKEDAESKANGPAVMMNIQTVEAYGGGPKGGWRKQRTTQQGLKVPFESNQTVTAVLFPRLASHKPPVITAIADGNGLRVDSDAGTDYVFFAQKPIDVKLQGGITFKGRVGVIQIRKDATYLTLNDGESITAGIATLNKSQGKSLRVPRN